MKKMNGPTTFSIVDNYIYLLAHSQLGNLKEADFKFELQEVEK